MLKTIAKLLLAFGLIFYLVKSGRIDFSILQKSLDHKLEWFLCFACLILNVLLGTLRWKNILEIKAERSFSYLKILKIGWIGLLFNTVLPGSVSGDFIKLVYAKPLDEKFTKTFLVTSVFLDRIFGLVGLLTLLGLSSIYNYGDLTAKSESLANLIHFNFLIFFGIILFIASILMPSKIQDKILGITSKVPVIATHLTNTFGQVWLVGKYRKVLFTNVFLSMAGQTFFLLGFWIIASPFFNVDVPFKYALTFIPLGLCTIAIPITPQGLGIGHAAFDTLFGYFGIDNGASLFNLYFISGVLVNLIGAIPYVLSGKKNVKAQAQQFETSN